MTKYQLTSGLTITTYLRDYTHSRFIPEKVAEESHHQIFLRDTHILPEGYMRNTADITGGKVFAV
jgi:hypothetical protein